jgi:hypothetical protein
VPSVAPRTSLATLLEDALTSGDLSPLAGAEPLDRFDASETLLGIHDLWCLPLPDLDGRERFQNHPVIADLKWRLEAPYIELLDAWTHADVAGPVDAMSAMRRIARQDDAAVYDWLATTADWEQLVRFLALEGGPDGGFDDFVAVCQVGLRGGPKVVMGANYWDEMGRGEVADVHTILHDRLSAAIDMPRLSRSQLPQSALDRTALNGLLATNRWLQPEMIGALGLLELQAGPRCRQVLRAMTRLGAPEDAFPFYQEHADTDPRHGKEWLDGIVAPLVEEHPSWGCRIIRGAAWRAEVNRRLFDDALRLLAGRAGATSATA